MTVVPMQERHLAALAAIEQACFHAPWSEAMLREELGKGLFLAAEQAGRTVGYVGCQTVLDEGYITNVAVSRLSRWRCGRPTRRQSLCMHRPALNRSARAGTFIPPPQRTRC